MKRSRFEEIDQDKENMLVVGLKYLESRSNGGQICWKWSRIRYFAGLILIFRSWDISRMHRVSIGKHPLHVAD